MNRMMTAVVFLAALGGAASAYPTIEFLPPGYLLTDLSTGGVVGCGNVQGDGSYETFRWTSEDGVERLGRPTVSTIGVGGGSPDISHDGRRISASILSSDNQMTLGIWDPTYGWIEAIPPMTPDGMVQDQAYGSAWGLSGDGTTVTGHYYSNWSGPTRARPSTWSQTTGMVALPSNAGVNCRVNASSFDGLVVGGWEDHGGPWWPTVWRNGVKTNINDGNGGGGGQVWDVSYDGSILVGSEYQESIMTRAATIWTWNGSAYVMQNIGVLPGTVFNSGQAYLSAATNDGSMAVGSNLFTLSPGGARAGVVWTSSGGLQNATDYIVGLGLASQIPAGFEIREVAAISPDGSALTGIGLNTVGGYFQSFVIRLAPPPCPGDADRNQVVNFADVTSVLANFSSTGLPRIPGDADGNGVVSFADITSTLAHFDEACP